MGKFTARKTAYYSIYLCIVFILSHFILFRNDYVQNFGIFSYLPWQKRKLLWMHQDSSKCTPVKNIAYLKAHKTASSAIQGILFRFGVKNGLKIAVPQFGNYFGKIIPFHSNMIDKNLNGEFDINIFAIHTQWNFDEIRSVMPNDTIYIASVREPVSLFESLYTYANFEEVLGLNLDEFVLYKPKNTERAFGNLGYNQMAFDFGLSETGTDDEESVQNLIRKADSFFDLVLVAEYFDESLVLLKHLLCWDYEDMVTFKVNARRDNFKKQMKAETSELLKDRLSSDFLLYNHFKNKMENLLDRFGKQRIKSEIKELERASELVWNKCNLSVANPDKLVHGLNRPYSEMVNGFKGNIEDENCKLFVLSENSMLDYVRKKQQSSTISTSNNFRNNLPVPFGAAPLSGANIEELMDIFKDRTKIRRKSN